MSEPDGSLMIYHKLALVTRVLLIPRTTGFCLFLKRGEEEEEEDDGLLEGRR